MSKESKLKNLKPFQKGHAKVGGKQKGYKHTSTIIKEMLGRDALNFLIASDKTKDFLRKLKNNNVITIKEVIIYRMLSKAAAGDQRATEWLTKQTGEESAKKVELTTNFDMSKLSTEQLIKIANGEDIDDNVVG